MCTASNREGVLKPNNEKFKKYKLLKLKFKGLSYKRYPLDMVLGSYIAQIVWRGFWRTALRGLLFKFNLSLNNKLCCSMFSTYTFKRDDYLELIFSYLGESNSVQVQIEISKRDIITGLPVSFYYLFKALFFLIMNRVHVRDWYIFLPLVSMALKVIDNLERIEIKCDKYIAFNSSYFIESFLSFYFKIRSVPTFSLQHGMYFEYLDEVPLDVINYENICSDNILLWGDYSFDQINRYIPHGARALVYGYPYRLSLKDVEKVNNFINHIYVLLPRLIYWDQSVKLLNKLKLSGECFIIRPHPSVKEKLNNWLKDNDSINLSVDKSLSLEKQLKENNYRFVIGFNTTAVFQSLWHSQKVVTYMSGKNEFANPGFETFNEGESFDSVLKKIENYNENKYIELRDYCFKFPSQDFFKKNH